MAVWQFLFLWENGLILGTGSDGLRLWYIKNQAQLKVPAFSLAQQGAVTCVQWITRSCDAEEILCYGTALGYVGVWAHQPVSGRLCATEISV